MAGRLTEAVPSSERCVRLVERSYGTVPFVSIHVYAPVLTRMTRYAVEHGQLRTLAVDQAGRDW